MVNTAPKKDRVTFSDAFGLDKSQGELDFVNVPIDADLPLFVDPFAIAVHPSIWCMECNALITSFFQQLVDLIRNGDSQQALRLLSYLREPNETRLGLSKGKPQGAGIGSFQAQQLLTALEGSTAVKTGFITSISECELMIEGVGRDKISDLTTNVIRSKLIEYTIQQCELLNIPTQSVPTAPCFDPASGLWVSKYAQLPVYKGQPIMLVPKVVTRFTPSYDHQKYYRHFVLNYLEAEALNAHSSLVHVLKNGNLRVYKTELEELYPLTKEFLYEFSRDNPQVLTEYREALRKKEQAGEHLVASETDEALVATVLIDALRRISPGTEHAGRYHNLMIGALEFIFFPHLINPKKEQEIQEGRKRIDIMMENGATQGIFHRIPAIRKLPCPFIAIECKNYSSDPSNPELDQLAGRFSPQRGRLGFLCCRSLKKPSLFKQRCIDNFKEEKGLIVPLADEDVINLLDVIRKGKRKEVDDLIAEAINEIWVS